MITRIALALAVFSFAFAVTASAQDADAKQKVAALKSALQKDQAALRKYEWIETTVVTMKGEEKSREQNRCYYGAEGSLQKVPVSSEQADSGRTPRGIRGKIVANKKEELSDYMKEAVELLKSYVPPDPARIQAAVDAGKLAIIPGGSGKPVKLEFRDYQVQGDTMAVEIDFTNNYVLGLAVQSFLGADRDPVSLNVTFNKLQDGTGYPAQSALDATAKKLGVTIEKSGYRKTAP